MNSRAHVVKRLGFRNLDVFITQSPIESPAVVADVEVTAREDMLVQLDLSCASDVHEVFAFARRKGRFERSPVRLAHCDWEGFRRWHAVYLAPPSTGGTPACECLHPMQHTQAVARFIAS